MTDALSYTDTFIRLAEELPRDAAVSTPADRHPEENQDRVYCDQNAGVAAVFDGMGGHSGGELASIAALGGFLLAVRGMSCEGDGRTWLRTAIESASHAVKLSQREHRRTARNQGATAAAAVVVGHAAAVASVGDSRVYLLRDSILRQVTEDDCWGRGSFPDEQIAETQRMIDHAASADDLTGAGIIAWHQRNVISAELGTMFADPEIHHIDVRSGDLLILTTDGVHDNLTFDEIQQTVAREPRPAAVSEALVDFARSRSRSDHFRAKDDDITAATLRVP
jgi:serine/threonine protein phosphatase PrpC